MKYDIFKHGIGTRVRNFKTNKTGFVKDIKETFYEWIEPYVLYDGEQNAVRSSAEDLVLELGEHYVRDSTSEI